MIQYLIYINTNIQNLLLRQLISPFSYGVAVFDELPPVIPIMHHPKIQLFLSYICRCTILPPGLRSSSSPTSLHLQVFFFFFGHSPLAAVGPPPWIPHPAGLAEVPRHVPHGQLPPAKLTANPPTHTLSFCGYFNTIFI